ncbi:C4-type zinc finger DksA/TraR family protein [Thermodesulfatator indicus DSM 15286]|uniref:C4-type zinc finger DksA/TraR family protein n=1 Tax=Thermodesulfatator indicus (strain DSM 15286 / JCM 11887 / CIR29812) TaxID=667014 RepID=F8ABT0_THEID|nr:TraR/DksA C4-type zinc finger protein [Thermodesulfatator indicus]AEH44533.1 C4-type zinc finger DksA/TraR family protein [Thermodesulfatator indicus DSM 15286]
MSKHERRPLTEEEIEYFKEKLLKRKKELWREVADTLEREAGEEYQDLIRTVREEEDLALADLREDLVLASLEPKIRELEEIEQALIRIELGEYGRCIDCGKWLRTKRLEIMPWAARCRECQEKWEKLKAIE